MLGATVTSDWVVGSPIVWTAEWQGLAYEDKGVILRICPNEDFDQIQLYPIRVVTCTIWLDFW